MKLTVKKYLASIGSKGGSNGKGPSKRRDASHYQRLAEIRRKNRKKALTERKRVA